MSLLRGTRAYLCGPIEASGDAVSWRAKVTKDVEPLGIEIWDPLNKPKWVPSAAMADGKGQKKLKEIIKTGTHLAAKRARETNHQIRMMGLRLAYACDFIICKLTGEFTVGTFEELDAANRCGKPIFIWSPEDSLPSMWLYDQIDHGQFYESWDDLLGKLRIIDSGKQMDPLEWIFFSWRKHADEYWNEARA